MERTKNDVWVGLFVLIGAAALVFLALQAANLLSLSFGPSYRVSARFDNIGGLKPKAAVKSADEKAAKKAKAVEKAESKAKKVEARAQAAAKSHKKAAPKKKSGAKKSSKK